MLSTILGAEEAYLPTVIQSGSFGLIAVIVLWFLKVGIPENAKTIKGISDSFIAELSNQRTLHSQERKADREEFQKAVSAQFLMIVDAKKEQAVAIEKNTQATKDLTNAFKEGCAESRKVRVSASPRHGD